MVFLCVCFFVFEINMTLVVPPKARVKKRGPSGTVRALDDGSFCLNKKETRRVVTRRLGGGVPFTATLGLLPLLTLKIAKR